MPQLTLIRAAKELAAKHGLKGKLLEEAIPYIRIFSGKRFVLKIGGSILDDLDLLPYLIEDVIFLKQLGINLILVHGGSCHLNEEMKKNNLKVEWKNGLRVTSAEVLILAGRVFNEVSRKIKEEIERRGYKGVIFNKDSGFITATPLDPSLGYVGKPAKIKEDMLKALDEDTIAIVSSVVSGVNGGDIGYNVNADSVAELIASTIKAEKLILMTDVEGILDAEWKLIPTLNIDEAEKLIAEGVIHGGMIPKVRTCLNALKGGTHKCHIIRGCAQSFMDEVLTDRGVGTQFVNSDTPQICEPSR